MRIAVIYSGYLRLWERMLKTNKAYLFTPETDLFFYTYDEPTNYPYKQYIPIKAELFYPDTGTANILQQWHNSFMSFCLVPSDYDVYVRSRGDVILSGKIDFNRYDYSGRKLYVPQAIDWEGINDQFAFGNYETMKIYYSLYVDFFKRNGYLVPTNPEKSLLEYLLLNGVEIIRIDVGHTIER